MIKMISFEEAQRIVNSHKLNTSTESLNFIDSLGRVLAEDIKSDMDMPPFNKSAVDGYACRLEDLGKPLKLNEIIPAGSIATMHVRSGECTKVMTGAAVPEGANFVFMIEDAIEKDEKITFVGKSTKDNIAKKAEDIKNGDTVLKSGRTILPQDIAVLATVGCTKVLVKQKIKLGIISTGDELVEPNNVPSKGQIRNSNAYQLIAQSIRAGANAHYFGIAPDNEEQTFNIVARAFDECNLVLLTGGVSVGDFDFVPKVLKLLGVNIIFDKIAVQPGKPTTFGVSENALAFGLPGNPISSFLQFELFVRPLIQKSMNSDWKPKYISLRLAKTYSRKRTQRHSFVPVSQHINGEAVAVDYHGSAHINALTETYGLMELKVGVKEIKKGDIINVRQL